MSADYIWAPAVESRPPVTATPWPVGAAVLCAVAAVVVVPFGVHDAAVSGLGYLLGALGTPALVVGYRFARRSAARSPYFVPRTGLERLALLALGLGIAAGVANAWFFATEVAKR